MSFLDEAIPPLEDLEPEELKYLRKICKALREFESASKGAESGEDPSGPGDLFDADELGLDPEFDNERW